MEEVSGNDGAQGVAQQGPLLLPRGQRGDQTRRYKAAQGGPGDESVPLEEAAPGESRPHAVIRVLFFTEGSRAAFPSLRKGTEDRVVCCPRNGWARGCR